MPNLSYRQIAVAPSHSSPLCCFRSFPSVSMEIWLWIVWFIFMICYIYLAKLSIFLCSVPHPHSPDLSTSSSFFALVIPFYLSFSFFSCAHCHCRSLFSIFSVSFRCCFIFLCLLCCHFLFCGNLLSLSSSSTLHSTALKFDKWIYGS